MLNYSAAIVCVPWVSAQKRKNAYVCLLAISRHDGMLINSYLKFHVTK